MAVNKAIYGDIKRVLKDRQVTLVAVSKIKPVEDIRALYDLGQKDFGENYVQEMVAKAELLPKDISWHFIGHLQSNKVKYIAPFVFMIHGVDSVKLLREIDKQAGKCNRSIACLLQVHIAAEETKFGFNEEELAQLVTDLKINPLKHIKVEGLMGMASFSDDMAVVRKEFGTLKALFDQTKTQLVEVYPYFNVLSMGMSGDYITAIEEGSTMVRIGSLLFGQRAYK